MALETVEKFLNVEEDLRPEAYDFREEIMTFQSDVETAIDRYVVYQATGERDYRKDQNVSDAACDICDKYIDEPVPGKAIHADSCDLIKLIYDEGIFINMESKKRFSPCRDREGRLTIDTMNSCNTTINLWLSEVLLQEENAAKLKEAGGKGYFGFPNRGNRWAVIRSILLFEKDRKLFNELLAGAKEFLEAAYTIGNFIPWPAGCNSPRGIGCTKDYWDLALKCIYDWYRNNPDLKCSYLDNTCLFPLCEEEGDSIKNMVQWLVGFNSWDDFIEAALLQDYTEQQIRPYGCPRELWPGHFSGPVLPTSEEQMQAFFANAAQCIKARSERIVTCLKTED